MDSQYREERKERLNMASCQGQHSIGGGNKRRGIFIFYLIMKLRGDYTVGKIPQNQL